MSISNDIEFRQAISELEDVQQRELAGLFVDNVMDLGTDERIARVNRIAMDKDASEDELAGALKTAKATTFDSHTRCGSEGDWTAQAGYFVARAATAALTPVKQCRSGGPAWQAAMSCRMARTSRAIDDEDISEVEDESAQQYRILENYLSSK